MLVVMGIVALLIAFAAPRLSSTTPSRKAAAYEVVRILELARTKAIAERRKVYVAFAEGQPDSDQFKFRAYAIYGEDSQGNLVQLGNWAFLPFGLIFASSALIEVPTGSPLTTIFEISQRRPFPVKSGAGPAKTLNLTYVSFDARGSVTHPPLWLSYAANIGLVEGTFDRIKGGSMSATSPGEVISIAYHTGLARVVTD